jgi:hypothetical protein
VRVAGLARIAAAPRQEPLRSRARDRVKPSSTHEFDGTELSRYRLPFVQHVQEHLLTDHPRTELAGLPRLPELRVRVSGDNSAVFDLTEAVTRRPAVVASASISARGRIMSPANTTLLPLKSYEGRESDPGMSPGDGPGDPRLAYRPAGAGASKGARGRDWPGCV